MEIIGKLLKKGIRLRESLEQDYSFPADLQKMELRKLLIQARSTEFGHKYHFNDLLTSFKHKHSDHFYQEFRKSIPVHNYNSMYANWWHKLMQGTPDVCWPGKVKYFALSSGTSESASKHIPVTKDMIKSIQRTSIRQILTLSKYNVSDEVFSAGILMLGGSTQLQRNGSYFEGDLSGITTGQIPFWFQHFYKPGKRIAKTRDWNEKIEEITLKAKDWDIGIISGVPAWLQILMEKIIAHYKVETIHDIWPNLTIFVHGGVSMDPYRKSFEKLLAKPLIYMETYLASEGFFGFQYIPYSKSMRLVLNNGIFYEFIPFNESNFTADGEIIDNPETLKIDEVEEGKEYALLISTNAGSWRYLIGDTIKFVSKDDCEIMITGRTKHFLSLCGEHLSMDNMNKAVELVSDKLNIRVKEFTVTGEKFGSLFAHRWYIGIEDDTDPMAFKELLDAKLKEINDDYKVERTAALKEVFVELIPSQIFYKWMKSQGKEGGQHKFPRVLKKEKLESWKAFLDQENIQLKMS